MREGKWGHLDLEGNWTVKPVYQRVDYFFDGLARVMKNGCWGVVDTRGNQVVLPQFNTIEFSGEFFKVNKGGMSGLVNRNGELVTEPQYAEMGKMREGLIPAKEADNGLWGYLNVHGQWAIKPRFSVAYNFGFGHALVKGSNSLPQIINHDGKMAVRLDSKLDEASYFADNGVAWILLGGKYGLLRVDGQVLVEPELEAVSGFGADWIWLKYPPC